MNTVFCPKAGGLRNAWAVALALLLAAPARTAELPRPAQIDLQPVLQVDETEISSYLLEKYHERWAEGIRRGENREPTANECRTWMESFVARAIVAVHAVKQGYAERPEVSAVVDRMTRQMLTQSGGPLSGEQQRSLSVTEDELRELFARTARLHQALVVRFETAALAEAALGPDFDLQSLETQLARLQGAKGMAGVRSEERMFRWPFQPFAEIDTVIEAAPPGQLVVHKDASLGVYCMLVRSIRHTPLSDFAANQRAFAMMVKTTREQVLQLRRRVEVLTRAAIEEDATGAERMIGLFQQLAAEQQVPSVPPDWADQVLFRYHRNGELVSVSLDDFCRYQEGLMLRRFPRNAAGLHQEIGDFVLREADLAEARARGLDQTPRFREDRRGFALMQALDLFTREKIMPQIRVEPAEIEREYRDSARRFSRPLSVKGQLLVFSSPAAANGWAVARRTPGRPEPAAAFMPQSIAEVEVGPGAALPGLENLTDRFVNAAENEVCGPIPREQQGVIFVRGPTLTTRPLPLAEVEAAIRIHLEQVKIGASTVALARAISPDLNIHESIDWPRYGVTDGSVVERWRAGALAATPVAPGLR